MGWDGIEGMGSIVISAISDRFPTTIRARPHEPGHTLIPSKYDRGSCLTAHTDDTIDLEQLQEGMGTEKGRLSSSSHLLAKVVSSDESSE